MPNFIKGSHSSEPERYCKYIHRYCNQTRLEGYDFCIRHILEDKNAPFKQCSFVNQPNKKKCTNAAPRHDKHDRRDHPLCPFHTKRALMRHKISHQPKKKVAVEGPAALLRYLEHYCTDPVHDPIYHRENGLNEKSEVTPCVGERPITLSQVEASIVDGESIEEKVHIESMDDDFCWAEKTGDYLEHAGVYTEKEVLKIAKEKIVRLQELYCTELNVIYHELKEKRRSFLSDMQKSTTSDHAVDELNEPVEIDEKALKALTQYHKCEGMERIFRDKNKVVCADAFRVAKPTICTFERNDVKCTEPTIVLTKFCKKHILSDPNQVMFSPCGLGRNCKRPIIPYEETAACDQHFHLAFSKPRADETAQAPPVSVVQFTEPEPFQSMDDIASLGLDGLDIPSLLFGLDPFGEPGESTDTVLSEDLMKIPLNPPENILSDSRKSESE